MARIMETCGKCGTKLTSIGSAGLCPRCFLQEGLTLGDDPAGEESPFPPGPPRSRAEAPAPAADSRWLGDFELLEELARGGMGVVYKARQVSLNRIVALKMILPGHLASSEAVRRLHVEAEAAARLDHPNIVSIYGIGQHQGQHYFAMRFVAGHNLSQHLALRSGGMTPQEAARLLVTVARAVHHAHQRGILHRDLKPANILVDAQGAPHVADFGLARQIEGSGDLTLGGVVLGTPNYMSPEQTAGATHHLTTGTDIYSLGAVLYFLLTGRPPFEGTTPLEVMRQVVETEPVPPSRILCKRRQGPVAPAASAARATPCPLDRDLETICLKCLEKDPNRRYTSADALADDLEHWLRNEPIRARPLRWREHVAKWVKRNPAPAAWALAAVLVAGVGLAGIVWQWRRADRNAASELHQRLRVEATVVRLEMEQVDSLLGQDRAGEAVAKLARLLRRHPDDRVIAARLISALSGLDPGQAPSADSSPGGPAPESRPVRSGHPLALEFGAPGPASRGLNWAELSPDGSRVLTAGADFAVRVWDARTGQAICRPMLHPGPVRLAHFNRDGRLLASSTAYAEARIWDATTGEPLAPPLQHGDRVLEVQFSPDGRWLATASADGTARLWEARTGQPAGRPLPHRRDPAARLESDEYAAEFGASTESEPSDVLLARFSPDGRRLATACQEGTVWIWDPATSGLVAGPLAHGRAVTRLRFDPNGTRLVTLCSDGIARTWDARTGRALTGPSPQVARWVTDASSLSPDGTRVIILSRNTAQVCALDTGNPIGNLMAHAARLVTVQFSPDGTRVALGSEAGIARIWDVDTALPVSEPMPHGGAVLQAQFSPDGQWLLTVSSDGKVRLWDVASTPAAVPCWLPELAEAVIGWRLDENDMRQPGPTNQLARVPPPSRPGVDGDYYSSWLRWFLATGTARGISPRSPVTLGEHVQRRIAEDTLASLREAARLAPTNQVALTRLDLADRRARIQSLQGNGRDDEALALAEESLARHPDSVWLWHTKGWLQGEMGRKEEAVAAYARAMDLAGTNTDLLAICRNVLAAQVGTLWGNRGVATARATFSRWLEVTCSTGRQCREAGQQGVYLPLLAGHLSTGLENMWDLDHLHLIAEHATRLDPSDWRNFQFLGIVLYRNEDHRAAAEAFQAESRLRHGRLSGRSLLFLAMACQKLGDPDQAVDHFTQADQWWQRNADLWTASQKAELKALRLEAQHVLCAGVAGSETNLMTAAAVREAVDAAEDTCIRRLTLQGKALMAADRLDEAISAFDHALQQASADRNARMALWEEARLGRAAVLQRLGRMDEAAIDNCLGRGIPPRDAPAPPNLIDLSLHYNGSLTRDMQDIPLRPNVRNDLSAMPRGVQRLGPLEFDVRGVLNLRGTFLSRSRMDRFPVAVTGIPLHRKLTRLHVLHGTIWRVPMDTVVGRYVIHFADGEERLFPIVYGVDVHDWHRFVTSPADRVTVAWEGTTGANQLNPGSSVQVSRTTIENPRPHVEVTSLDFVSTMTDSAPFLIALTVE